MHSCLAAPRQHLSSDGIFPDFIPSSAVTPCPIRNDQPLHFNRLACRHEEQVASHAVALLVNAARVPPFEAFKHVDNVPRQEHKAFNEEEREGGNEQNESTRRS